MNIVTDIETVAGLNPKTPRMEPVAEAIRTALATASIPVLNVRASDNICSAVDVFGSFDARETWANGIVENSRFFRFSIMTPDRSRYYDPAAHATVTVKLLSGWRVGKFRKYTGTPAKVAAKLAAWIATNKA